jgi:hypothetical protein
MQSGVILIKLTSIAQLYNDRPLGSHVYRYWMKSRYCDTDKAEKPLELAAANVMKILSHAGN